VQPAVELELELLGLVLVQPLVLRALLLLKPQRLPPVPFLE
jgi:hypothetical protein